MKNPAIVILLLTMVASCKSVKTSQGDLKLATIVSSCPDDGVCTIAINKSKAIIVKKDEFGHVYYETETDTTKDIVVFNYTRSVPKGIQDGGYREEIVIQVPKNTNSGVVTNFASGKVQILYGRFCFCKGYTGYYNLSSGKLTTLVNANKKEMVLEFTVSEVPQVIKNLSFTLK